MPIDTIDVDAESSSARETEKNLEAAPAIQNKKAEILAALQQALRSHDKEQVRAVIDKQLRPAITPNGAVIRHATPDDQLEAIMNGYSSQFFVGNGDPIYGVLFNGHYRLFMPKKSPAKEKFETFFDLPPSDSPPWVSIPYDWKGSSKP